MKNGRWKIFSRPERANIFSVAFRIVFSGPISRFSNRVSGKDPLGWSSMCWLSWFSGLGCCSGPGFRLRLGASNCSPGLAFCFMGPWTFAWVCCPQLPDHPCKNGTHSTCFYSTGGHTRPKYRRKTNVQQLTCNIDLSCSFYYLFFSCVLIELKPFVLKGEVLGERFWKSLKKCEKILKRFCPLVVAL